MRKSVRQLYDSGWFAPPVTQTVILTSTPMNKSDFTSCMNNTKWEELIGSMTELGELAPLWRTMDVESGYLTQWDGDWHYHIREGGFDTIEWIELKVESDEQSSVVLAELKSIGVPGVGTDLGFKVFGFVRIGEEVDYL